MNTDILRHPLARFTFDVLKVVSAALAGLFFYALVFQLLIGFGLIAADVEGEGYGRVLTERAMLVWVGAIALALAGLFIRVNWRWTLLLAPAYGPALYALMAGFLA